MALCSITLGTEQTLKALYSYPNIPGSDESLKNTIEHWFGKTLACDQAGNITATVSIKGADYILDLDGPADAQAACNGYATRLPAFLTNGLAALNNVVPKIQAAGKWNPDPTDPGDVWRFFLPFGLPMLNQKSLQFFHYPPLRLLDPMRDYLNDPVPVRWEELLRANGVAKGSEALYECVMDATPIAAPDDQGSKKSAKGDPVWGLIPIQEFADYQKSQVQLLLNAAPGHDGYTIPIVVFGAHPRDMFNLDFSPSPAVKANVAARAAIVAGKTTAVLGSNHPYMFYAVAQGGDRVGSGKIADGVDPARLASLMIGDLAAARWQMLMADDASQDPAALLQDCTAYWKDPARSATVAALIAHQGSLFYPPEQGPRDFTYLVPCPDLP